MSDTGTIQQQADQLRAEAQRLAGQAGYSDVQQYLAENESDPAVQQLAQQVQELQQQAVHATVKTEREKLFENAPGLQNKQTRQAFAKWLKDERGYTDAEIAGTLDHRVMTDLYRSYRSGAPKKTLPKKQNDKPSTEKQSNGADTDQQSTNGTDAGADNGNAEHADNDLRSPIQRVTEDLYGAPPESTSTPEPNNSISQAVEILYPDPAQ